MKTQALLEDLNKYKFDAAFGGACRDEEKSRAKERIYSFRDRYHQWDPKNQRPELWDNYNARVHKGESIRVFPITNNTVGVGMIIDKLDQRDLPSRITSEAKQRIERGQGLIDRSEYISRYNQVGTTLWITGLHGSGKNNLAYSLERRLFDLGVIVVLIDGFTIRSGLSKELDFSPADRAEHLRRVAHICRILNDQGIITICSFISPNEDIRQQTAEIIGKEHFHLIYVDSDLEYCRNFKPELYKLSDEGKISGLPGVDIPYEIPADPSIICKPEEDNLEIITQFLAEKRIFQ